MINQYKPNTNIEHYDEIEGISSRIISCNNCSMCCHNSSAFVLSDEAPILSAKGIDLYTVEGLNFIRPTRKGFCPALNENNKCSIYEHRPLSCRIFPLYLMNRQDFENQWVLYNYCPKGNYKFDSFDSRIEWSQINLVVDALEMILTPKELQELSDSDRIISKCDGLEFGVNQFSTICKSRISK